MRTPSVVGKAMVTVAVALMSVLTVSTKAAPPQFGPNLVTNGDFSVGTTGWFEFATPNQTFMVSNVTSGVYQFFRNPPPAGTANQATLFQETGAAVPAHTALTAQFRLGNSSTVRKRISVLVLNFDFADLSVCTFFLDPGAPLNNYQMRTHTTRPWTNAAIYFFAATTGSNNGFYQIDDVSLRTDTTASPIRTDCLDPNVPPGDPGGGGIPPPSILGNGDFGTGSLPPWGLFGQIVGQIVNNVFEFHRPPGTPSGTILQPTGVALPARELIVATFHLGNSSSVRKRVTVILHDADFSDLSACTFFLAPGQPLSAYGMRSYTTKAWTSATFSLFPATVGLEASIRLDTVELRTSTAQGATGTECFEPSTPFAIALSPAALGIPTQAQGTLTASISAPAPVGGTTINLLSSDTNVATVPASVVVLAGQMTVPVTVTTSTGTGGATITATSSGLASSTATITNALRTMTLDATTTSLQIGVPVNGSVTLAQPAPPGGASITLVSSDPNINVTSPVAIVAGATQGSFVVTANAASFGTITGSAPGFANATLDLTAQFRLWISDVSGFWDVAANWKDGIVPGPGDSVAINRPTTITVTIRTPTAAVNVLQANEALNIQSTLTVNGTANLDGGMTLTGSIAGSGTVTLRSSGAWPSGTLNVASFVVASGQTLALDSSSSKVIVNSAIQNNGIVAWTAGAVVYQGNGSVTNAAGATWDAQGDLGFSSNGSGTQTFANAGVLKKSGGTGSLSMNDFVSLANTGTIQIGFGSFVSGPAWSSSGHFAVSTGAVVHLQQATLQSGSTFSGGGTLTMAGTTSLAADVTVTLATSLSGTLIGPGKWTLGAPLTWSQGAVSSGGLVVPVGQTLMLTTGTSKFLVNSTLQNSGTVTWTGGTFIYQGNSSVVNAAGATWDAQTDLGFASNGSGTQTFANAGVLKKSGGSSTLTFNDFMTFSNTGTLQIQTGSFSSGPAWTSSGLLNVSAGAVVHLQQATLQAGSTFSGGGSLTLAGSTALAADVTVTLPATLSGTLNGPGKWTLGAPLTWSQGNVSSSGLVVPGGQTLTLTTGTSKFLVNSTLQNNGTVTWTGGTFLYQGNSSVVNAAGATWDAQTDLAFSSNGAGAQTFANAGVLKKSGGSSTLAFNDFVTLSNTGTLQIQTGSFVSGPAWTSSGQLNVSTGAVVHLQQATLQAGSTFTGGGSLTLAGSTALAADLTVTLPAALSGTLNGPGKWTLGAPLTWSQGAVSSGGLVVPVGQTLTLTTGTSKFLTASTLQNNGTVAWAGGTFVYQGNSSVVNAAGATWDAQTDLAFSSNGSGVQTFANAGVLKKSGGSSTLTFNDFVTLSNTGTLQIQAGSFASGPAWSSSGQLNVSTGAVVHLQQATLQAGSTFTGGGSLTMAGSTALATDLTVTLPATLSGTLNGPGKWTLGAPMTWSQGSVTSSGLVVAAGQTLTLTTGTTKFLVSSTLQNNGTVAWDSGAVVYQGNSSVVNAAGATWDVQGNVGFSSNGGGAQTFTNAGLVRKSGALGTFSILDFITFTTTGTIELRLGGTAAGQFDAITLGQPATLAGTLDVQLANGFVPTAGNSFAILSYPSVTGVFATIVGNGHTYTPTYGATTLTIQKQ